MQDNNHEKPNNNRNNEADEGRNIRRYADGVSRQRRQVRPQGTGQQSRNTAQRTVSSNTEPHATGQHPVQTRTPQRRRAVPPDGSQQNFEQYDMPRQRPQQPRNGQSGAPRQRPVQPQSAQSDAPRPRPQQARNGQSGAPRPRPAQQQYTDQSDAPQRRPQQYPARPYMEETYPQNEQAQMPLKKNAPKKKNTSQKTKKKEKSNAGGGSAQKEK